MPRAGRIALFVGGVALAIAVAPSEALAQSCAMCKSLIQSGDDPLARGINLSVALMVAAPFAVVGSIGGWLAYAYRRGRRPALPDDDPNSSLEDRT